MPKENLDGRRCENCFYCEKDDEGGGLCCVCVDSVNCAEYVPWWDVCGNWGRQVKGDYHRCKR